MSDIGDKLKADLIDYFWLYERSTEPTIARFAPGGSASSDAEDIAQDPMEAVQAAFYDAAVALRNAMARDLVFAPVGPVNAWGALPNNSTHEGLVYKERCYQAKIAALTAERDKYRALMPRLVTRESYDDVRAQLDEARIQVRCLQQQVFNQAKMIVPNLEREHQMVDKIMDLKRALQVKDARITELDTMLAKRPEPVADPAKPTHDFTRDFRGDPRRIGL